MEEVAASEATTITVPGLRAWWSAKEGNTPEQYEDAFASFAAPNSDVVTIAVADGASSAVFAREWANLLARAFGSGEGEPFPNEDGAFASQVASLGREWRGAVEGKATTWHAQEKLATGSSAALLVVTIDEATETFTARSVGDVCLFVIRRNLLKYAFPITHSSRFGDRPALLSTEPTNTVGKVTRFSAPTEPGDRFLLMTDALSAWFLAEWERKRQPWYDLPAAEDDKETWLKKRRDSGDLKNDDVTLIDFGGQTPSC